MDNLTSAVRTVLALCAMCTVLNVALAMITYGFLLRVRDRARDVDFWFMHTPKVEDDDD